MRTALHSFALPFSLKDKPHWLAGCAALSLACFSMAPSCAEAGLCYVQDGSARWLTAMDKGIVYLPSMPAQQEVINTGNWIQRQETPLPPTEFKLNAILLFLAKSRIGCLGPAELAVARPGQRLRRLFQQFSPFSHPSSDRPSQFQSPCCLCFIAGSFILHYSKTLSYSIFLLHWQDLSILSALEYLWKVYFICIFFIFYCYSCANRPP